MKFIKLTVPEYQHYYHCVLPISVQTPVIVSNLSLGECPLPKHIMSFSVIKETTSFSAILQAPSYLVVNRNCFQGIVSTGYYVSNGRDFIPTYAVTRLAYKVAFYLQM